MDTSKMINNHAQWDAYLDQKGVLPKEFWESSIPGDVTSIRERGKTSHGIGTTGIYNKIYGNDLAIAVLYGDEGYQIMSKFPYLQSGHRAVEALETTATAQTLGGAIQTAAPNTYSQELYTTPGLDHKTTDVNIDYELLDGKDNIVPADAIVQADITAFKNMIDTALFKDSNTLSATGLESIDRAIGATGLQVTGHSYTAADEDFMAIDRSANAWFDCNYNDNDDSDRPFQLDYLEDQLESCESYADGPNGEGALMILTGRDTLWKVNQAASPQIWNPREEFSLTIGGVSTQTGTRYNIKTPSIDGYPIFGMKSGHVQTDGISRMYVVNNDYLGVKLLTAPYTTDSADPIVTGYHLHRYVHRVYHQLFLLKAKSCGTVWDIA